MKANKRNRNVSRMAAKKPADKPVPPKPKATSSAKGTRLKTDEGRRTSSTSNLNPVVVPIGEKQNHSGGENNKTQQTRTAPPVERVTIQHAPGLVSKTYELTPDWDKHEIVEVVWVDAIANAITEWMDLEDLEEVQPCETLSVGYLLKDHPEWITIVALLNEGSAGHAITIPRGMILDVRVLSRP